MPAKKKQKLVAGDDKLIAKHSLGHAPRDVDYYDTWRAGNTEIIPSLEECEQKGFPRPPAPPKNIQQQQPHFENNVKRKGVPPTKATSSGYREEDYSEWKDSDGRGWRIHKRVYDLMNKRNPKVLDPGFASTWVEILDAIVQPEYTNGELVWEQDTVTNTERFVYDNEVLSILQRESMATFESGRRRGSPSLLAILRLSDPLKHEGCSTDLTCLVEFWQKHFTKKKRRDWILAMNLMAVVVESVAGNNVNTWSARMRDLNAVMELEHKFNFKEEKGKAKVVWGLPPDKRQLKNQLMMQRTSDLNRTPHDIDIAVVFALKNYLQRSDDWLAKVLLVQLLTGSRFIEVLEISDYYGVNDMEFPSTEAMPWSIIVYKVAKDKRRGKFLNNDQEDNGDMDTANTLLAPKPILWQYPPEYIQCLVYKNIRPFVDKSHKKYRNPLTRNAHLTNLYNSRAIAIIRQFIPKAKGTHTLRKIYANFSYDRYSDKTMTRNAWITTVLGHRPTSVTTSLAYTTVRVKLPVIAQDPDLSNQVAFLLGEVGALRQEVAELRAFTPAELARPKTQEDVVATLDALAAQLTAEGKKVTQRTMQDRGVHPRQYSRWFNAKKNVPESKDGGSGVQASTP